MESFQKGNQKYRQNLWSLPINLQNLVNSLRRHVHRDDVSGFIGDQRGVDSQHHGGICDCVHRLSPAHCQHRHRSACALLCNVHSGKDC